MKYVNHASRVFIIGHAFMAAGIAWEMRGQYNLIGHIFIAANIIGIALNIVSIYSNNLKTK